MRYEVNNLSFAYKKSEPVFNDLSFFAESKDLLCILGPNGVGKSTLFKCMLGRRHDYSGDISIDGRNIRSLSRREMSESVAYIPQHFQIMYDYTVMEMVLMGTARTVGIASSPRREQYLMAESALDQLNITHLADKNIKNISGGERQLVYIARALAQNAKALIMDEPASALDYGNQIKVMNHIQSLADKGYIIILSSHNPYVALNNATKVLVLKEGRILAFGKPSEVIDDKLLSSLYDEQIGILEHNGQKLLYQL